MNLKQIVFATLSILFIVSCAKKVEEQQNEVVEVSNDPNAKKVIAVTNYPIFYFTSRIVGDKAEVLFPMASSGDPAYWKPTSEAVSQMQAADLILLNGAGYEQWLDKVSLSSSKLFNTSESFKDQYIEVENFVTHSHGDEEEHTHAAVDFTLWIDFSQASLQVEAIAQKLSELIPTEAELFNGNAEALKADLNGLDEKITQLVKGKEEMPLVVSHPVYGYFARKYDLNIKSEHWEPTKMPSHHDLHHFDELLEKHPAQWIIWEGTPDQAIVDKLAKRGLQSAVFSPCADKPESGDFMSVMKENIAELEKVFKEI